MPQIILPFSTKPSPASGDSCNVLSLLSRDVQAVVQKTPHLMQYLGVMPVKQLGVPKFCQKLDRSMTTNKTPNYIYPVTPGVFTHILYDKSDGRNTYIPIEPISMRSMDNLLLEVEKRLIDMTDFSAISQIKNDEDKKAVILKCLEQVCSVNGAAPRKNGSSLFAKKIKPLELNTFQYRALQYLILRDKIGMGIIDPIITDKYVEDISCSGMGTVFIEHKIFKSLKSVVNFTTMDDLDKFVMRMAERIRKPVSVSSPIVDATLPDGSRINIVYGKDVSKRGSNFTIRKFSETPMSVIEIIGMGTLDCKMAAYLSIMLGDGMNLFVCGETASGKTTTMNAITTFIPTNSKIVSIEDTPELQVPHKNWIREVVRANKEADSSNVGMFDLLKAALRQRPNEIIIGEIRGAEGAIAFQAMQTGHSVMATFHAASVERLIQRLTGDPINVPKTYIDNLNVVVIQSAVKLPSGQTGRRMVSISEIIGYDPSTQSFIFVEVFHWDPVTDTFEFTGQDNSYLLEYKIAPKLGIPPHKKQKVYSVVERRTKIIQQLKTKGIKDFYELLNILAQAQNEGIY